MYILTQTRCFIFYVNYGIKAYPLIHVGLTCTCTPVGAALNVEWLKVSICKLYRN